MNAAPPVADSRTIQNVPQSSKGGATLALQLFLYIHDLCTFESWCLKI